ncbi:DEAD-box ATP-dependent RNA helicase 39 [Beta vulgaris subsp. vulgaris]|uniref:DEAD-box ATP-dependent RNA helicase 39 n=1 Tax=Beta vulgaris subsp. vulgaris TaxID=3555 RepID=UPI00053FA041|nr:DEAD-box ATP-dependent RNA helicase 39 [Beta vulgaris subsp. vulgaris]
MRGTGRSMLTLSISSNLISHSLFSSSKSYPLRKLTFPHRVLLGFRPLCSSTTIVEAEELSNPSKQSILLERLRVRHLKDGLKTPEFKTLPSKSSSNLVNNGESANKISNKKGLASNFGELGLSEEVMGALEEMGISVPTEIQCVGIPAVLERNSVVLGSHTGSGKTLAYMLPIVQLLRRDEDNSGIVIKPRRPRAVVLCPTRELSEQVFRVAKSISHHARFRTTMISGGGRLRPQEDSLNLPIDMVVGTPGRILQHIEDGNMVYGDIKYIVLDEADTMFDRGFGPDIRKFLGPLKNRASKPNDPGFQTILVAATMTKAVQMLVDEEFQGIIHLRTSTLHKKVASARHDFIRLSGAENKLEALLQVLEPSLSKGNKVMVFCNTLDSSRAVDHFLSENQIFTVNYHGEVPAEQRVENLKKFKDEDGDCPTLVCTDLAARGLDLDVDHVIMFDFPKNSVDYLHRTGRTARMGAKGKVTCLVAKRDVPLANRIEEAIKKNESLESLSVDSVRRDIARTRITQQQGSNIKAVRTSTFKNSSRTASAKSAGGPGKSSGRTTSTKSAGLPGKSSGRVTSTKSAGVPGRSSGRAASAKPAGVPGKGVAAQASARKSSGGKFGTAINQSKGKPEKVASQFKPAKKAVKVSQLTSSSTSKRSAKISVVGFRGRSSSPVTKN